MLANSSPSHSNPSADPAQNASPASSAASDDLSQLKRLRLSKIVEISGSSLVSWSPNGALLAMAKDKRVVIRSPSMEIVTFFNCAGPVESIQWSADSELVLTRLSHCEVLQVWRPSDQSWRCRIADELAGIVDAVFSPCARHVLTLADFNLHACVWSLCDESKSFLPHPKSFSTGLSFSVDGRFAALLQRKAGQDSLGLFSVEEGYKPVRHFKIDTTDSSAVSWSPTSGSLCVVDTPLVYLVLVYSPDGDLLSRLCAYEDALGARSHCWSPDGSFLSIGSFDEVVRTVDTASWSVVSTVHAQSLKADGMRPQVGWTDREGTADAGVGASTTNTSVASEEDGEDAPSSSSSSSSSGVFEEVYDHEVADVEGAQGQFVSVVTEGVTADGARDENDVDAHARTIASSCLLHVPRLLTVSWRDLDVGNQGAQVNKFDVRRVKTTAGKRGSRKTSKTEVQLPPSGIQRVSWSPDGRYYAVQNARYPSVIFIWRIGHRKRNSAVVLKSRVRWMEWHPSKPLLALCTGDSPRVFVWTPSGAMDICVPSAGVAPQRLLWAPNAAATDVAFCFAGRTSACVGALDREPSDGDADDNFM